MSLHSTSALLGLPTASRPDARRLKLRRNLLSFVTQSWLEPIYRTGYSRPLQQEDLPDLPDGDKAVARAHTLDGFWRRFREHKQRPEKTGPPNLGLALCGTFIWLFSIVQVVLNAVTVVLTIQLPLMIPQNTYGTAALLFAMQALKTICSFASQSIEINLNIKVRATIVGAVFGKILRLSPKEQHRFPAGKINTIATTNAADIQRIPASIVRVVASVAQILLALVGIIRILKTITWVPVVLVVACIACDFTASPWVGKAFAGYYKTADARTKVLREFLYGVKIVKFSAAEEIMYDKIQQARSEQVGHAKRLAQLFYFIFVVMGVQRRLVGGISIAIYASVTGKLDASEVFTALGLFNALIGPADTLGAAFGSIFPAIVSYKRIVELLLAEEATQDQKSAMMSEVDSPYGAALKMSAASFTWEEVKKDDVKSKPKNKSRVLKKKSNQTAAANADADKDDDAESHKPAPFALQGITLDIPRGSLVAVVGSVGSGKSSLLSALIGGMRKTAGDSALFGSVAYCSQEPWILTGTIEENIVFGDDSVRARIPDAVAAACLDRDLEILPNGLGTQIGEKGINLSGGQKSRVALARAIARDADIYLLDDPIAALDAHVGKKVFDDAICGVLRGKTVILVTHQLHLLPKIDMVVVLDEGRVVETGAFRELMAREDGALAEIMKDYHFDDHDPEAVKEAGDDDKGEEDKPEDIAKAIKAFEEEKAVAEDRRTGAVGAATIMAFFRAGGRLFLGALIVTQLFSIIAGIWSRIFLEIWVGDKLGLPQGEYLRLYIGFNFIDFTSIAAVLASAFAGAFMAGVVMHNKALDGLFKAPLSFFDGQPIGRILNRMTGDVQALDFDMVGFLITLTEDITGFVGSIVIVSYTSPYILIQFAFILILLVFLLRFYQRSFREIKRLSSIMRSPLAAHISETINGVPTILAYGTSTACIAQQQDKMDLTNASVLFMTSSQYRLGFRLEIISSTVTFLVVVLAAAGAMTPASIGLALASTLQLSDSLNEMMRMLSNLEGAFNAVERLDYYAKELPAEAARELPTDPKDGAWPTAGAVAIRGLEIRYPSRPDHAVIQDLSLDIRPGEKVGVVGRTGSGKSTLMTALFRIMEASKGSIAIDGIDIASLGLKTLRSRLQIIPQDPVLFKGTVRSNLDFGVSYTDDELWAALGLVGLKDFVGSLDGKLDAAVEENGANLSMGQRQLMCLCKAILAKPKVLIMDEATASVDAEADKRIQESIETQFAATTVLSIAHRLNTIAAFDRVLVLDGGRIAEFDAPHVLLGRAGSVFGEMVDATGAANAAVIRQIAADHFAKTRRCDRRLISYLQLIKTLVFSVTVCCMLGCRLFARTGTTHSGPSGSDNKKDGVQLDPSDGDVEHAAGGLQPEPSRGQVRESAMQDFERLTTAIDRNHALTSLKMFLKLEASSPDALVELSHRDFAKLAGFVVFSNDLPTEYTPQKRVETAEHIWAISKLNKIPTSSVMWRAVAEGHARTGNVAAVEKLLATMRDQRLDDEAPHLLAAQSRAYLLAGDKEKGMAVWHTLSKKDDSTFPLEYLVRTHVMCGDTHAAELALHAMRAQFGSELLGASALREACRLFLDKQDHERFVHFFSQLRAAGGVPDGDMWVPALRHFVGTGRYAETIETSAAMKARKMNPSRIQIECEVLALVGLDRTEALPALIAEYARLSPLGLSKKLGDIVARLLGPLRTKEAFDKALASSIYMPPLDTKELFNGLLSGYVAMNDAESVKIVLRECLDRGGRMTAPIQTLVYNCIERSLGKNAALGMVEQMLAAKHGLCEKLERKKQNSVLEAAFSPLPIISK
ncbi:hypothetical protein HK105_202495 [Polyrhizophydium stewartii]|uniref:ABC transporter n=1 Tax=Polyrhizophydium stewartii TaxID=2732419 RepID=A0ABR4NEY2_9FUNG|nr:hypothetical protein HK105_003247 [Polyrhizophydium stewartii]